MAYKMTFGRKFFSFMLGSALLWLGYYITLIIGNGILSEKVFLALIGAQLTLALMYVGGNVWNQWVRSKHFRAEIFDSEKH